MALGSRPSEGQTGSERVDQSQAGNRSKEVQTPWIEGRTIGQALRETARRHPDADAFVFTYLERRCTWAELDQQVDTVARGLLALGMRRGDTFGVWATNVPEWVLLQFATARIGVVLVTINPAYQAHE